MRKVNVTRADVYAARVVVACDRQLGQETPKWIRDLAALEVPLLTTDDLRRSTPAPRSRCPLFGVTQRTIDKARDRLIAALERKEP